MPASTEALQLLALLPDAGKYAEKLRELVSKTEAANTAIANLAAAEKASSAKLETADALLGSLQGQINEIEAKNAAAAAKIEAAETDLARRETELESARQQHADAVATSLKTFAAREDELRQKQAALDADFHSRVEALRGVEDKLRDHHSGLCSIIGAAQRGLVAAVAA